LRLREASETSGHFAGKVEREATRFNLLSM